MSRTVQHLRGNAIAYLALFVALGGTSYAALKIPAGSVGARQIKNHSITPVKLNNKYFNGNVRAWAIVDPKGKVVAGAGKPVAQLAAVSPGSYLIRWGVRLAPTCATIANVDSQRSRRRRRPFRFPAIPSQSFTAGYVVVSRSGVASRTDSATTAHHLQSVGAADTAGVRCRGDLLSVEEAGIDAMRGLGSDSADNALRIPGAARQRRLYHPRRRRRPMARTTTCTSSTRAAHTAMTRPAFAGSTTGLGMFYGEQLRQRPWPGCFASDNRQLPHRGFRGEVVRPDAGGEREDHRRLRAAISPLVGNPTADCSLGSDGYDAEFVWGDNGQNYGAKPITINCHGQTYGNGTGDWDQSEDPVLPVLRLASHLRPCDRQSGA